MALTGGEGMKTLTIEIAIMTVVLRLDANFFFITLMILLKFIA